AAGPRPCRLATAVRARRGLASDPYPTVCAGSATPRATSARTRREPHDRVASPLARRRARPRTPFALRRMTVFPHRALPPTAHATAVARFPNSTAIGATLPHAHAA